MSEQKLCRLCQENNDLCDSHIIPKGLLKISKGKNKQLIALDRSKKNRTECAAPCLDNVNWNEKLLCKECERHINLSYETSQIAALKQKKIEHTTRFTITGFDYERFYLFWLSILWRASKSSHSMFKAVQLPLELDELIRQTLKSGSLVGSAAGLPDFLQIGISRWFWDEADTRSVISSFISINHKKAVCLTFLVGGLAIIYQFSSEPFYPLPTGFSLIKKTFSFRMEKLSPGQSPILDEILAAARDAAIDIQNS